MNPFEVALRYADRFQQGHGSLGLIFGVVKKFGDDNAGVLASNLAFSAFGAVFPLLLLLVSILGLVLAGDPGAQDKVIHSALSEFPIIGNQLGKNIHALQKGSPIALAIALLGLLWGCDWAGPGGPVHHGPGLEPSRARPPELSPTART